MGYGRVAQSVARKSQRSRVRYPVQPHTFVSPSADSRRAVASYWRNYVHEVLVNRLRGLSLPRKSVVRLTDHPDMTLAVYRWRKTMKQQQQQLYDFFKGLNEFEIAVVFEPWRFTVLPAYNSKLNLNCLCFGLGSSIFIVCNRMVPKDENMTNKYGSSQTLVSS